MTTFCSRCCEPLVNPAKPCGFCVGELTEKAITALAGNPSDRAHAIWFLQGQGHSTDSIAAAVAEVAERKSVGEILERLLAGAERVGVVA